MRLRRLKKIISDMRYVRIYCRCGKLVYRGLAHDIPRYLYRYRVYTICPCYDAGDCMKYSTYLEYLDIYLD